MYLKFVIRLSNCNFLCERFNKQMQINFKIVVKHKNLTEQSKIKSFHLIIVKLINFL